MRYIKHEVKNEIRIIAIDEVRLVGTVDKASRGFLVVGSVEAMTTSGKK